VSDDLIREINEDISRERFKAIWKKYGKIISNVVIGVLVVVAAYVGWQRYTQHNQEKDGLQFSQAMELVKTESFPGAVDKLSALVKDGSKGYALLSRFELAEIKLKQKENNAALAIYDEIIADNKNERIFRDLAKLYKVYFTFESSDVKDVMLQLGDLLKENNAWRYSALELAALASQKSGDVAKSVEYLKMIIDGESAPSGIKKRANEMLTIFDNT
jgi:hypothetical protein